MIPVKSPDTRAASYQASLALVIPGTMGVMETTSHRRCSTATRIAALLVCIAIVYPLSVGPAALLMALTQSARVNDAMAVIYNPLNFLPEPISDPIDAWGRLWIRLAP